MATHNFVDNDGQLKTFKTFPEFSKLTLADKSVYEALIKDYPPISEISFPTLMLWWNQLDMLAVSLLDGNLVISYWLPGDELRSGLSIVGTTRIDLAICTIFDYLQEKGEAPRLVHVPEFVMQHMEHPELFSYENERNLDEYLLPLSKFYPLQHIIALRRHRIRRFLSRIDEEQIVVRSLDLSQKENQRLLLDAAATWPQKGTLNAAPQLARDALQGAVGNAEVLGTENMCLYIGGTLHAFLLYHLPADRRYAILSNARLSYGLPFLFDYMVYAFARHFHELDISYINLDVDYGVPMMRMIRLALGPSNFFRKYTIEPARGR